MPVRYLVRSPHGYWRGPVRLWYLVRSPQAYLAVPHQRRHIAVYKLASSLVRHGG